MPTALQTLQELDEGRLLATLQNAFHDAAAAVKQHGKAATIIVNRYVQAQKDTRGFSEAQVLKIEAIWQRHFA